MHKITTLESSILAMVLPVKGELQEGRLEVVWEHQQMVSLEWPSGFPMTSLPSSWMSKETQRLGYKGEQLPENNGNLLKIYCFWDIYSLSMVL